MIGETFLAFYSNVGGGAIGNLLFQWEQAGVFSYLLPFLLIFALVFGLLSKMNIFGSKNADGKVSESKGINVIIAIAVSLMSLQFNLVSIFFAEIFPRFGIALSIVLVLLILSGLFINPDNKGWMTGLGVVSLIIVAIVVLGSLDSFNWYVGSGFSYFWGENWGTIVGGLVFLGLIVWVIVGGSKSTTPDASPLAKLLRA